MNDVRQITRDEAYETVAPGAFDKIIPATHDHFRDPLDPRYIDFA